jgi:ribosomal protein S27AE
MIEDKVCPKCGYQTYIQADLTWNSEKQDWVIADISSEINCAKCGNTYKVTDCKNVEK